MRKREFFYTLMTAILLLAMPAYADDVHNYYTAVSGQTIYYDSDSICGLPPQTFTQAMADVVTWPSHGTLADAGVQYMSLADEYEECGTSTGTQEERITTYTSNQDYVGQDYILLYDGTTYWHDHFTISSELVDFTAKNIFSDYRFYDQNFDQNESFKMLISTKIDDNTYSVYADNLPSTSGPVAEQLIYNPAWDSIFAPDFLFAKQLGLDDNFHPPGSLWEESTFNLFIDVNGNGTQDTGDFYSTLTIPSGSIQQLGVPTYVNTSLGRTPTITWDAVDGANRYFIRIFEYTNTGEVGDILFNAFAGKENGSAQYAFDYQGDLFSQYDTLVIAVLADQVLQNGQLVNRSEFYTVHSEDDNDGDGFTDAEEVLCGSDPFDSNSGCTRSMPWLFLLLDD